MASETGAEKDVRLRAQSACLTGSRNHGRGSRAYSGTGKSPTLLGGLRQVTCAQAADLVADF